MIKKSLLLLCALTVQAGSLGSCEGIPYGAAVSEVGTVSDQPELSVTVSDDTCREYLSTEGDGEILLLYDDGTFLAYTVTDLAAEGENGSVSFVMTEQMEGAYTLEGETASLAIEKITYSVTGLEEHPDLVEKKAAAIAGENSHLHALYVKLFGGEAVDGRELLGEEHYSALMKTEISANLDEKNSTFTYKREQTE